MHPLAVGSFLHPIPLQTRSTSVTQTPSAYAADELQQTPYAVMRKPPTLDSLKHELEHERRHRQQLQDQVAYLHLSWRIDHAHVSLEQELSR